MTDPSPLTLAQALCVLIAVCVLVAAGVVIRREPFDPDQR